MSKPWNQPPRKKIVPECVGEISSTKECCAVDGEEKEEEEEWRSYLDLRQRGTLLSRMGKRSGMQQLWPWSSNILSDRNCLPRLICLSSQVGQGMSGDFCHREGTGAIHLNGAASQT